MLILQSVTPLKLPIYRSIAALLILFLSGCATVPKANEAPVVVEAPTFDFSAPELFSSPILVPTETEIFTLSDQQKNDFSRFLNRAANSQSPMHIKVFNYLERVTKEFKYETKTYNAQETLLNLKGNCMSLAVLTTALANYAEVEVKYQLVDSDPIYYRENNVVVKGVHVRSKLYKPLQPGETAFYNRSSLIVDYLPSENTHFLGNISHDEFMTHYLRNLAVEYLDGNQLPEAYWHARKALEYSPDNADILNVLAVVFRRAGDEQKSEAIYLYGLTVAEDKLTLLKNYRMLLNRQQRFDEAAKVTEQMAAFTDANPFEWLKVADEAFARGDMLEAAFFYQKVIDEAPYLEYAYLGLAKIDFQKGDLNKAKKMLQKAIENAFKDRNKQLYLAKLNSLEKHIRVN